MKCLCCKEEVKETNMLGVCRVCHAEPSDFDIDKMVDDFLKDLLTTPTDGELKSVEESIKKSTPCYECPKYNEYDMCVTCINDEKKEEDVVNNPSHYTYASIEPIKVISDWKLNFNLGNALKYIARCEHKGNKKQDIQKAIKYLQFELEE